MLRTFAAPTPLARKAGPSVAARYSQLHTRAALLASRVSRIRRFFSGRKGLSGETGSNSAAASSPSRPASSSASSSTTPPSSTAAAGASLSSSPHLFDASHLLSNLEDKRETLQFLEVSSDGTHQRDVTFSRAELSSMLGLHPRDLRFLDASMRNLPSILARRKVIIVNLDMFKALITADRVLMSDTFYPHVKAVVQPMQASVLNGGELYDNQPVPFEFIALEHILLTVCRNLEARFDVYLRSLAPLLSDSGTSTSSSFSFTDKLPSISMLAGGSSNNNSNSSNGNSSSSSSSSGSDCSTADLQRDADAAAVVSSAQLSSLIADGSGSTLMHLLQLKNGLTSFEVTLRETGNAMRDLLETDEDMAQMYLTLKQAGTSPHPSEHGEVEVILETYLRKVDELLNEVEQMVRSITLTEEHIQIRLDSTRNSMMKLELLCSISTLGVTAAALGAALFGMNLPNGLEQNTWAFLGVTAVFMLLATAIIRKGVKICKARNIHLLQIEPQEPALRLPYPATTDAKLAQISGNMAQGYSLAIANKKRERARQFAKLYGQNGPLPWYERPS